MYNLCINILLLHQYLINEYYKQLDYYLYEKLICILHNIDNVLPNNIIYAGILINRIQ